MAGWKVFMSLPCGSSLTSTLRTVSNNRSLPPLVFPRQFEIRRSSESTVCNHWQADSGVCPAVIALIIAGRRSTRWNQVRNGERRSVASGLKTSVIIM